VEFGSLYALGFPEDSPRIGTLETGGLNGGPAGKDILFRYDYI
jgi:hypothetical protein